MDQGRHVDETLPMQDLSQRDAILKRTLDISLALILVGLTWWLMILAWGAATLSTRQNGLFTQWRIGRHGIPFRVFKIRTMRDLPSVTTTATVATDPRITPTGRWLRRLKLDELPQLFQIIFGQMSFVGPRPDVPGFADHLAGPDRSILNLRPGLTGPATLVFRHEEDLLQAQADPEWYNREVIYPEKVRLNRSYLENYSIRTDLLCIFRTALRL